MRRKQLKVARLKHQMERAEGVETLQRLTPEEKEEAERIYNVQPWLYKVHINFPFNFNLRAARPIVKDMYYYRKETGHFMRYIHLNTKQVHELREAGLEVALEKYKVTRYPKNDTSRKVVKLNKRVKQRLAR